MHTMDVDTASFGNEASLSSHDVSFGQFQCGTCKKQYKRVDHLARHVRTHTRSRPYQCHICPKAFGRTDLLKRHVLSHGSPNSKNKRTSSPPLSSMAARVTQACQTCSSQHLRCTERKPCQRCVDKGLDCTWDRSAEPELTPLPTLTETDDLIHTSPVQLSATFEAMATSSEARQTQSATSGTTNVDRQSANSHTTATDTMAITTSTHQPAVGQLFFGMFAGSSDQSDEATTATSTTTSITTVSGCWKGTSHPSQALPPTCNNQGLTMNLYTDASDSDILLAPWMPLGGLDFDPGFDLNDVELRFLEAYNTNLPFEFDSRSFDNYITGNNSGSGSERVTGGDSSMHGMHGVSDSADALHTSSSSAADLSSPSALGTEAFRNHYWKFRPNVQDHGAAEEHNLSLPSGVAQEVASPESRISVRRRVTCARLSISARDKILATVMKGCRTEDLARVVESFPTAELLDTLLQYYLTSPIVRTDTFLHAATFDPNMKRPELLAALVAAGAVLTADAALCKLGLAIQECLRTAIPRIWEQNNTLTRDIELWQAYLVMLEIGLWSGYGRKVEIAESFLQPLITMFRRDGKFKRSSYPRQSTTLLDDGEEVNSSGSNCEDPQAVHAAWMAWILQESYKRLAFRLLEHDTNVSFSLLVTSLISYAEVQLPLPDPIELWAAPTASTWRAIQHQMSPNSSRATGPLTLADYINDPGSFQGLDLPHSAANNPNHNGHHRHSRHRSSYSNSTTVDASILNSAFLSFAWRMTWEHTQLSALQRAATATSDPTSNGSHSSRPPWNALLMSSRHEEIMKLLSNFRMRTDMHTYSSINGHTGGVDRQNSHAVAATPNTPMAATYSPMPLSVSEEEITMRLELILMHLHTPFEEIQVFAGMDGVEQARLVQPTIQAWVQGESARRAVWHAAQLLRAAKLLPPGLLCGAAAIMVYHASLSLWVYGLFSGGEGNTSSSGQDQQDMIMQHQPQQRTSSISSSTGPPLGVISPATPFVEPGVGGVGAVQQGMHGQTGHGPAHGHAHNHNHGSHGHGHSHSQNHAHTHEAIAFLDGPDDMTVQRFVQFGRGSPCLHGLDLGGGDGGAVPLSRPDAVMQIIVVIMQHNYRDLFHPHLVDNLIHLMGGLQKASAHGLPGRSLTA